MWPRTVAPRMATPSHQQILSASHLRVTIVAPTLAEQSREPKSLRLHQSTLRRPNPRITDPNAQPRHIPVPNMHAHCYSLDAIGFALMLVVSFFFALASTRMYRVHLTNYELRPMRQVEGQVVCRQASQGSRIITFLAWSFVRPSSATSSSSLRSAKKRPSTPFSRNLSLMCANCKPTK